MTSGLDTRRCARGPGQHRMATAGLVGPPLHQGLHRQRHCQVNRNSLFFDAKSILASTKTQRLSGYKKEGTRADRMAGGAIEKDAVAANDDIDLIATMRFLGIVILRRVQLRLERSVGEDRYRQIPGGRWPHGQCYVESNLGRLFHLFFTPTIQGRRGLPTTRRYPMSSASFSRISPYCRTHAPLSRSFSSRSSTIYSRTERAVQSYIRLHATLGVRPVGFGANGF